MTKRDAYILRGLVSHYIRSARPIGSHTLLEALSLSESPATIRTILRSLEEQGYIYQPHTSAGRIPTDKGYRFYVDTLAERHMNQLQRTLLIKAMQQYYQDLDQHGRQLARTLSQVARTLAISARLPYQDVQESGLSELVQSSRDSELNALKEASYLLDSMEHYLESLGKLRDETQVFIGKENPYLDTQHTSVLVRTIPISRSNEQMVLLLIGPKRMPYQRNIALLNEIASIFKEFNL